MRIEVLNGTLGEEEIKGYVEYLESKFPDKQIENLTLTVDNDYVDMSYSFGEDVPFERIRRITGYLVGTVDRFNNAKRAEVEDRVKHSLCTSAESL
ncbi:MAG: hypothetical protein IJ809_00855 [Clostridia bacterium]|nr:hypothetical protein [Clostridia bacterium]